MMFSKKTFLSEMPQKTFLFLMFVFALRLFVSITMPLIDDEAYHWSWTLDLQLSYFDHPAMVAWLESLTLQLLGPTYLGVRLPFLICFCLTVLMAWKLAFELFNETAANFTALLILFTPFYGFGGFISSPEPPFILSWMLAAWVFWQGVREDHLRWSLKKTWIWLGILMGVGLNSKFIMAMLAPGFGIYLLMTPHRRKDLLSPWPWVGFLIATFLCLPIFTWNFMYDWPGFKFQFAERHNHHLPSMTRWFGFIGTQIGFYTPVLYALMIASFISSFLKRAQASWRFIFSLSFPSIALFYPHPYFSDYKPHWSGPACLFIIMGAGALYSSGIATSQRVWLKPKSKIFRRSLLAFLIPLNLFIYSTLAYPWLPLAHSLVFPDKPWITKNDPSNEIFGWEELGKYVNRRQREVFAETGSKPFLASHRYETTAQTTWGTKQRVFMLNTTASQYTVTQTKTEIENLKGQNALFVVSEKYYVDPKKYADFDECIPEDLKTYRYQTHARTFTVFFCKNFKGIL